MIQVQCRCGGELELAEGLIGEAAECPQCKAPVRLVCAGAANGAAAAPVRLLIRKGPTRVRAEAPVFTIASGPTRGLRQSAPRYGSSAPRRRGGDTCR